LNGIGRNDFKDRLSALARDGAMEIYAWVLMPNHFHLLCKTKNLPLASSMRRILTGYVVNFNPAKSGIIADTDIYFSPRRRLYEPEGTLFNRVNLLRTGLVKDLKELN